MIEQTITINAPVKPVMGKSCKVLLWHDDDKRYQCDMVSEHARLFKWLPKRMDKLTSKVFKRWIAADTLCDADAGMD